FQAEDGIRGRNVTGVQTCALPISFRMILGLLSPTAGQIHWNGSFIDHHKSHLIGYLPEERGLYPKLKVREQLIYLGKLRGMTKQEVLTELKNWLERFKVPE